MENIHFLNGKFLTEDQLLISPRDLGFSRGYAVFSALKTYNHRPFKLQEHITRLFNSASLIGLKTPWNKEQVQKWVLETLEKNKNDEEKFIKIFLSGGISNTMLPPDDPTILILIDSLPQYPIDYYEKGIDVITVKHKRYNPAAKTNNYIEGVKQTQEAQITGAIEPLYYSDEQVYECSNSNIFAVINNKLLTTKTNILFGITRATLLEILKLEIPIETQDFTLNELLQAKEVFLTGSIKEIIPITSINGIPIGDGKVGKVTKNIMNQFKKYTHSNLW